MNNLFGNKELLEIGKKINKAITTVRNIAPTKKELEFFENYILQQEAVAPLLNPNFIQKHGFKLFDQAKERVQLIKAILDLKENKK